jgi:phosphoribosylformylglycinamidine synthase
LSDGGLAQVLVESCLRRNIGARITLPEHELITPFVYLFSESAGRVVVAVPRGHDKAFLGVAAEYNITCTPIGVTAEEPVLEIQNQFEIGLDELRAAYTSTMRDLFGGPGELAARHGAPEQAAHPETATIAESTYDAVAEDDAEPVVAEDDAEPAAEVGEPESGPTASAASVESEARSSSPEDVEQAPAEPETSSARHSEPAAPKPAAPARTRASRRAQSEADASATETSDAAETPAATDSSTADAGPVAGDSFAQGEAPDAATTDDDTVGEGPAKA